MSSWNREETSVVSCQLSVVSRRRTTDRGPRTKSARRGVLLLVVLSLLVLFMLIGTAYLMSSSQYSQGSVASAKRDRLGNYPTKLLDRALMQVLRDTGETDSVIRYHSLLRDLYGTDGIEAEAVGATYARDFGNPTDVQPLGSTQGQLIDILVVPNIATPVPNLVGPQHVIKLDRDPNGQPQLINSAAPTAPRLPLTKGYYAGALLTITSGPASGQSTRIVDYEFVGNQPAIADPSRFPPGYSPTNNTWRFRVMAFPRADGTPLEFDTSSDPYGILDLQNATFIINGRPFNGTGAGYNPTATAGTPRLNAQERTNISGDPLWSEVALTPNSVHVLLSDPVPSSVETDDLYGVGYPLDPLDPASPLVPLNAKAVPVAARGRLWKYPSFVGTGDADESYDAADFQNMALAVQTVTPRPRGRVVTTADTFELDDPAVVDNNGVFTETSDFLRLDLEDLPLPSFHRPDLINFWFHRLARFAADPTVPLDSGVDIADEHVRIVLQPYGPDGIRGNSDVAWDNNSAASLAVRDQIVAIKRRISLRPIVEDHPSFNGSNPMSRSTTLPATLVRSDNPTQIAVPFWEATGPWDVDNDNDGVPDSVWVDLGDPVAQAEDGTLYKPLYAFLIVDLDSRLNVNAHGLVEHLRAPIFAAIDNPNTATNEPPLIAGTNLAGMEVSDLLPHGSGYGPAEISLRPILSPLLPKYRNLALGSHIGNPGYDTGNGLTNMDDYARLLVGRPRSNLAPSVWGRYGSADIWQANVADVLDKVGPAMTYVAAAPAATTDPLGTFAFFGYPKWLQEYYDPNPRDAVIVTPIPSMFGNPPDLLGRYAVGLDHIGQPVFEAKADTYLFPNRSFSVDSPYEQNLMDAVRRDLPDPDTATAMAAGSASPMSDDAPFATADLERLLRSFDADSGILPDRLWNLVDAFDPIKLIDNQPVLVDLASLQVFGSAGSGPQRLAAAQQIASINRRLVTTDSYDLPVPAQNMPSWASAVGPDGQPGIALHDDDGNGEVDDPTEIGWIVLGDPTDPDDDVLSDDFEAVTGQQFSRASIVDLLRFRVFIEQRRKYMREQGLVDPLTVPQQEMMLPIVFAATRTIVDGDVFTDSNGNGRWDSGEPLILDHNSNGIGESGLMNGILAPEVIAGKRMDLNRPFGDGRDASDGIDNDGMNGVDDPGELNYPFGSTNRDPYMNGIVDDPLECGEPFLDVNGNGKWDSGEPFIDTITDEMVSGSSPGDHTGEYDGPRDEMWRELAPVPTGSGALGERIAFDYTNGHGEPIHPDVATAGSFPATAVVRNLDSQGRQLYARQLYCLMLLLVDEGYAELPDAPSLGGDNVNLEWFLEILGERNGNSPPTAPDIELAVRKLTARRIAQWAINSVDFRDADAIMTPFEYDENPWDGWGTRDGDGRLIPLDGDPSTNENGNDLMPAADLANNNQAQVTDWENVPLGPDGVDDTEDDNSRVVRLVDGPTTIADQSRGLVWGVERPELLISETLAFHDRRATDEFIAELNNPTINEPGDPPPAEEGKRPDYDLDQRLKPRGSLFVELYNPWSADGQRPAELYGTTPTSNGQAGVLLNRLSDYGATYAETFSGSTVTKRSPVWRLSVMRDPLNGRLMNSVIDVDDFDTRSQAADEAASYALQLLSTDIDGYGIDSDLAAERYVYFTTAGDSDRADDDTMEQTTLTRGEYERIPNPTPGEPDIRVPRMDHLRVRVPPLPFRPYDHVARGHLTVPMAKRYFLARQVRNASMVPGADQDVQIAPILPGRYAVVGSSGIQLTAIGQPSGVAERFVTPISRLYAGGDDQTDEQHVDAANAVPANSSLNFTRRFELWPSNNPNLHQLRVGANGGQEFVRKDLNGNGTIEPNELVNVTDANPANATARPQNTLIDPTVAIPVEDLNISEPTEGYPSLYYEEMYAQQVPDLALNVVRPQFTPSSQGELVFVPAYDHPLDLEFELVRNGTTQNYRSLHLQRLANPMLPWNPPPMDVFGVANAMHRPNLPVNPYLTIDSQSIDLTAYNGASVKERELPSAQITDDAAQQFDVPTTDVLQGEYFAPLVAEELAFAPKHVLWAVARLLEKEGVYDGNYSIFNIEEFREYIKIDPAAVQGYLNTLDDLRGTSQEDRDARRDHILNATRVDNYGRNWNNQWGWSLFKRVLPDDGLFGQFSGTQHTDGVFRQRLHLKSLERGAHHRWYDFPKDVSWDEGWRIDYSWLPRLLWKQERPNVTLFLKRGAAGLTKKVTDLKNVMSRRVLIGDSFAPQELPPPPDEIARNSVIRQRLTPPVGGYTDPADHVINFVAEHTLGFVNESYSPEVDRNNDTDQVALLSTIRLGAPEISTNPGATLAPEQPTPLPPAREDEIRDELKYTTSPRANTNPLPPTPASPALASQLPVQIQPAEELERRQVLMRSTYPWLAWNNRPFVSGDELTQVPAWPSSLMLRNYGAINQFTPNPYDGDGKTRNPDNSLRDETALETLTIQQAPYGHLLNFLTTWIIPAKITLPAAPGDPMVREGAPHFYRLLDFVEVPSRYVGTDTLLTPEVFNDPGPANILLGANLVGTSIAGPNDPRFRLQPPYNVVSRERDPGRVNLNTVTGRRIGGVSQPPQIWSEVFDGIMQRYSDGSLIDSSSGDLLQLGQFGPAWRDVVLSRKGYAQFNADDPGLGSPIEKPATGAPPDVLTSGLNLGFPTVFANPFRSANAGDLVPLSQMMQYGVDASWLRVHPRTVGADGRWGTAGEDDGDGYDNDSDGSVDEAPEQGDPAVNGLVDDALEAGFGDDEVSHRGPGDFRAIPEDELYDRDRNGVPLFSETAVAPSIDGTRNSYMLYQPMTRLGNLVTTRSNVYAIWVTVGYFEVERAPDWSLPETRAKFGATADNADAVTIAGRAMYDRVYPEGYALGQEVGIDVGNTKRQRAFYIIDRTEPVGFKPGEDLNVERMIRVRRRVE
jgi:hypothetical protein